MVVSKGEKLQIANYEVGTSKANKRGGLISGNTFLQEMENRTLKSKRVVEKKI